MSKIRSFFFSIHRIIGTAVSLLFLMWIITGLVLFYHPFPNVSKSDKYSHLENINNSHPQALDSILAQIPSSQRVKKIKLREFQGQTLFDIKTKDSTFCLPLNNAQQVSPVNFASIEAITKRWSDAPISRVDTLYNLEQWIMYTKYLKELPIYKLYINDENQHEIYISSQSGEVVQFTSQSERFWAWIGAIPHKLYIPLLRIHTQLWINVISVLGFLCLIASVSGLFVGVYAYWRKFKRKRKIESPYRKKWYWYHHVVGMLFSLILIGWGISGTLSLKKIPQWIAPIHEDYKVTASKVRGHAFSLDKFQLDYRKIFEKYSEIKEIEWSAFQGKPIYNVIYKDQSITIDGSLDEVQELYLDEEIIAKSIRGIHGEDAKIEVSLMPEYDEYYLARGEMTREEVLPLPVYKIVVDNKDVSTYYINPKTGDHKYINNNRKARKWLFSGIHYFKIQYFVERPLLYDFVIWITCIGGAIVAGTGVWISGRFIKRKIKTLGRKIK